MVNFGPLAAKIDPVVWGTPANFNWLRILAALLHGTLVVGVSQTLRRWTEGVTYVRQGDHHVGHCPHSSLKCLADMSVRKFVTESWLVFPSHLINASALPGKHREIHGNRICSLNCCISFAQIHTKCIETVLFFLEPGKNIIQMSQYLSKCCHI